MNNQLNPSVASAGSGTIAASELAVPNTQVIVGNSSGYGAAVAMSGDATVDNTGVVTIANGAVTGPKLAALNGLRNFVVNPNFNFWNRGTSTTITNTNTKYQADCWYVTNSLGTNGVITYSRVTGVSTGAAYGASIKITTAPTASQVNGCDTYHVVENLETLDLISQTASFTIKVKALGNVTGIALQFYYKTTDAKVDTAIGSAVNTTVNSSTFTSCSITGQALGSSMTTSGVVGVKISIQAVSSGNTYDLNNGYVLEQGSLTIGPTVTPWSQGSNVSEMTRCQRRVYMIQAAAANNAFGTAYVESIAIAYHVSYFPVTMRAVPTLVTSGSAGSYQIRVTGSNLACDVVPAIQSAMVTSARIAFSTATIMTVATAVQNVAVDNTAYLLFDAEI